MKRRGFFGLMGGAVVAGPAMAKEAVAGLEALEIGPIGAGMGSIGIDGPSWGNPVSDEDISPLDPKHWAQRELAGFLGRTAEELAEQKAGTRVSSLDPDIAMMRSVSLSHKIHMQRDRQFRHDRQQSERYLRNQLADMIKRFAS